MSSAMNARLVTRRAVDVKLVVPQPQKSANRARYHELELKVAALQQDYARLHTELIEAAQVHRRLCAPRLVHCGDFEIANETFAVRHVPGDCITIDNVDGSVILSLGDICGKGLAAGMWISHLVGLIGTRTAASSDPMTIVSGVNRDLCRISSIAPLATMFLAKLNPVTSRVDYCSAGHPPALLLRADGQLEKLSEGGPLLGAIPGAAYAKGTVELRAGDLLLICSDGILESLNDADQEFGYERLEQQLRKAQTDCADTVVFSVLGAVQDFAATRSLVDDMSLVIVKRRTGN